MKKLILKEEKIASYIHFIRGRQVILDFDLALFYGVETRALKQAVKRNLLRFPDDFMFVLKDKEVTLMVSQFVIPSKGKFGGALPMAFTEQGVAMLSGVLNSTRAVQVNIAIMRTFVQIRKFFSVHEEFEKEFYAMQEKYDNQFELVFEAIKMLTTEKYKPRKRIGFTIHRNDKKK